MQWAHKTGYGTRSSRDLNEAGRRAKKLYYEFIRAVPTIRQSYQLDIPKEDIIARFRSEFKKHQYLTDTQLIDRLVFQGRSELIDTINMFKTRSHVVRILQPNDKPLEQYHLLEDKNDVLTAFFKPGLAKLGDENIDFFSTFKEK